MSNSTSTVLRATLRNHLPSFIHKCFQTVAPSRPFLPNWHIDATAWHLDQCKQGTIKRLIITVPPRSGKSICASVAFPAFLLGHDPRQQIIAVSYSYDLSLELARLFRLVANSPWYNGLFPQTRASKDTDAEFVTDQGGVRFSTSVGGTLTGRGGDIIIIDDPIKPDDATSESARNNCISWFQRTLLSRLNSKQDGVIIVIMQRLHEQDLVGHLLETDPGGWTHLDLPAIAPEPQTIPIGNGVLHHRQIGELLHPAWEPLWVLDQLKRDMGSALFSAQYLQQPLPETGNLVKRDWFNTYTRVPDLEPGDQVVLSLDTANKSGPRNDPSVCTTWLIKKEKYYLLDVTRKWMDFPDLRRFVIAQYQAQGASAVLVEDAGSGTSLIQELQRVGGINVIGCKPKGDKRDRLFGTTATIEGGRVFLPKDAPWLPDFLKEVLGFPSTRYDDQVDSFSQFLIWADQRPRSSFSYDIELGYKPGAPTFEDVAAMRSTFW